MKLKLLTILFLLVAASGHAQSDNFRFKKLLSENPAEPVCFAIQNDGQQTVDFLLKSNVKIKFITKEWLYVTMSPAQLAEAQKQGKINKFYFEYAVPVALNDSARIHHRIQYVHQGVGGLPDSYTGKDIIIGYIDQGLDWTHPDFKDVNGHTRVLRYWDHSLPVNSRTPLAYGYGQAWDSTDIANNVCTSTENTTAHGTTVTGSGSGGGLANGKNKGVAPDSKIIMVETNFNLPNWTLTVADACDYIFKVADTLGLPAVINISVGTYMGSHDGNDPASLVIESLLDEQSGRIVVCAAGNSGKQGKYHVHGDVDNDTSFVWLKNNPSSSIAANSIYFDLWADSVDFENVQFGFGADKPAPAYGFRGYSHFHTSAETAMPIKDTIYSPSGNRLATIEMYTQTIDGVFHMEALMTNLDSANYLFRFSTKGIGKYDMWSGAWQGLNDFVSVLPAATIVPDIVHYHMPDTLQSIVSSWNCSEKVISVGNTRNRTSHINNNGGVYTTSEQTPVGKLAMSSSKGPSRLGVVKPDISASGEISLSPGPMWMHNNPTFNPVLLQGGWHVRNGGTSMASPVVAGIAALYLEKCSSSTYEDFKEDLTRNAIKDAYTGTTPNYAYGYGKADALNTLLYSGKITGPETYCNVPASLTAVAGHTIDSVHWSTGFEGNPVVVNQAGNYTATIYYNGNCETEATTFLPNGIIPPTPLIAPNGTVLLASPSPNYQWYRNGVALPGETNQTITISTPGSYTVSTTSTTGCVSFSAPYQSNVGLSELNESGLSVFPNPTTGIIEVSGLQENDEVNLFDIQGKKVKVNKIVNDKLNLSDLTNGVYFLTVARDSNQFYIKIIKN